MEASTSTRNFAQQIPLDEYNNQIKKYTEKALLELKSQMATFIPKSNHNNNHNNNNTQSESDNDSADCSSGEQSAEVNVIVKTYKDSLKTGEKDTNIGLRKRVVSSKSKSNSNAHTTVNDEGANSLSNTIYAQRELELQEIQKLKSQIKKLKSLLDEEERKNHFLKLDLCNAQVDNADLHKALSIRDDNIKKLENKNYDTCWQIFKLRMFIGFIVILYIYLVFLYIYFVLF